MALGLIIITVIIIVGESLRTWLRSNSKLCITVPDHTFYTARMPAESSKESLDSTISSFVSSPIRVLIKVCTSILLGLVSQGKIQNTLVLYRCAKNEGRIIAVFWNLHSKCIYRLDIPKPWALNFKPPDQTLTKIGMSYIFKCNVLYLMHMLILTRMRPTESSQCLPSVFP